MGEKEMAGQVVQLRFKTAPWDEGEPIRLRILKGSYVDNGSPALILWQCDEEGRLTSDDMWCVATVNGVGPTGPGLLTLDANNMTKELVEALLALPAIESTDIVATSGFCEYPVVKYDKVWFENLADASDEEAVDAIMGWDAIMG